MRIPTLILSLLLAVICGSCASKPSPSQPSPATRPAFSGRPSWLPLGREIYFESDCDEAAKQILSFQTTPRWFMGYGTPATREQFDAYMAHELEGAKYTVQSTASGNYAIPAPPPFPRTLTDVPLTDHGCRLELKLCPSSDPGILTAEISLTAGPTPLSREVQHRCTNTLPFLFAIYVDHHTVNLEQTLVAWQGGVSWLVPLVNAGQTRKWSIRIDGNGLRRLLADASRSHEVSLVAAFSDSQHMMEPGLHAMLPDQTIYGDADGKPKVSMVIRSEPASVKWDADAKRWKSDSPRNAD